MALQGGVRRGDVIRWVERAEGVSYTHAVELLKREHFPLAGEPIQPVKQSTVRKLPSLIDATADDKKLLGIVVDYYNRTLKQSPEAMRYLVKRGLQSNEIIDRFRLGYANRTLCLHLPASNRAAGDAQRERLKQLGILRNQKPGHEHFNGSLVVPVFNLSGEVVEMYGRKIVPNLRPGTDYHTYLPGPHRGVWNEEALVASKDIILCEALIDAMTFWVAGYRQVTASYGVNGFTADHRAAFERHDTERVYIAYDRDEAGDKAAAKLGEELIGMGIECFRVQFPKGMDANEYALKTQPAAKALGVMLTGAAWMGKGPRPGTRVQVPVIVAEPQPAAEEPAAKGKMIEESMPEPEQQPERDFSLAVDAAPSEESPSRPMPMSVPAELKVEIDGDEVKATAVSGRVYRVLGLDKCTTRGAMRVNVKVSGHNARGEFCCHGDTLDMEAFRQRAMFVKQAAQELATKEDAIHREVGQLWTALGDLQREEIRKKLTAPEEEPLMDATEQAAAMALLCDPRLLDRVLEDFERCGVVGEETNKTVSYVAAVSRLLPKPLAIVVQSSSSAGKSSLMEAVLEFMPEEHRESYTAMTGQALFYMGQKNLKHKILAVSEEEGASRAAYALKLLQSEGKLNIASTGKDPVTGKHVTHEYVVEGPVMIFLTTTAQDVDEELLNRCIVLTVNEEQEQTRAIHRKQREAQTREGLWMREERMDILKLHRNAQRLLKPVHVVIEHLKDQGFPDAMTRTRRDHAKFLTLIQAITLLYQHQRETKRETRHGRTLEYIEATEADVELARQLSAQVLGPSLDELPPHTRRLLMAIDAMVRQECEHLQVERSEYRFTRRVVRQHTRWGDTQLRVHLRRLEEMEYLAIHRGAPGQAFVYQLCFDAESGSYDADRAGENIHCAGSARAGSGEMAGGAPGNESPASMRVKDAFPANHGKHRSEADAANVLPVVVVPVSRPNGHGLHMEVK